MDEVMKMEPFQYEGFADIRHLNTRKEGSEDDKELAVDIKFNTLTNSSICRHFDEMLEEFLFFSDTGAVRNLMLDPVGYSNELMHYRLTAMEKTFSGVRVKKIQLLPRDDKKIDLTFQVSLKPLGVDVAKLAEFLQEAILIKLEPENGELDL